MKPKVPILIYFLAAYILFQFIWWGYHIIELTKENGADELVLNKRTGMILGEGMVFILIISFGLWRIIKSIKKEIELGKRQQNFLLSVTHELKTPIASTKLLLQTLLKRNLDEDKKDELIAKTLMENKRLEEIVEAMLTAARIENNAIELHLETIELNVFFTDLKNYFNTKHVSAGIKISGNIDFSFKSDIFLFKTIIYNLIDNAFKYSEKNEVVKVSIEKNIDHLSIKIMDNGIGINENEYELLFNKFYRSEDEETRTKKGTGLGLFIVNEFVKLLKGKIVVSKNTPKGTIFSVSFPMIQ